MSLSRNILSYLSWLDQRRLRFDPEFLKEITDPDDELSDHETREAAGFYEAVRAAATRVVKGKTRPAGDLGPNLEGLVDAVAEFTGDDPLDEYFTRFSLAEVPNFVKRARRLETVGLQTDPGRHVIRYFMQASSCYIFGFYDAVAVLSRAVIEATLENRIGKSLPETDPGTKRQQGYLERLINWAKACRVLDEGTTSGAHEVRRIGNKAIHPNPQDDPINQLEARNTIRNVVKVLRRVQSS